MKALERKKGAAGFTLIEMAIVLVVIGLIIGAVLKGQDLIANARAKKFANFIRQGEVSQYAYYDRNGAFLYKTGPMSQITSFTNQTTIGAATYYIAYGRNSTKNAIVIVRDSLATPATWTTDDLIYAKSFDAVIDGSTDGNNGKVTALTTAGTVAEGNFTHPVAAGTDGWSATGVKALMYLID